MTDLQKQINRIKGLKQNKHKDYLLIEKEAQLFIWKRDANLKNRFNKKEDAELALNMLDAYIQNHNISSYTDMQNLSDLVYEEVMKHRIQKDIDVILADEDSGFLPDKQIDALHNIQDRIWILKEKIGITKKDEKDELSAHQELEKKMTEHIYLNRNEFTLYAPYKCSECSNEGVNPYLLRRRVKDFDVIKHPALSGRFLYNFAIIDDVKKGLITKEQASRYLRTSVSYITWIIKNERKKIDMNGISQDRIDELINNNPNLRNANAYKDNEEI